MKAIIVAGGRGERLHSLTDKIPKPMIKVKGKPILEHLLYLLKKNGVREFIFALCYLPKTITSYFGDGSKFGVRIDYTFEGDNEPLGTAGAILPAKQYINDTFIVSYADILRELNISEMINYHSKKKSFVTLHVYKRFGPDPKSMILFDKQNRITEFKERPMPGDLTEDFVWANGAFYILEPGVFKFIPKNKKSDFGKNIFPSLLEEKKLLYAYPYNGYFVDIGNLEKLEKARKTFTF